LKLLDKFTERGVLHLSVCHLCVARLSR